ncbi:amidohydrolase [Amphritea japonica]|uniref:Omega-amidase YafV n=1 Tax=Amphritea japonica ATCC BAA-1530 TaxID=1278309 RepID=A0A7R6SRW3_9GAMM|nr:amidohydrolase [Amphritea japonica]BBB25600.1 carbon-nitrogen hydrolase family protein [Amphritea japonica ATCC BAA-1530]
MQDLRVTLIQPDMKWQNPAENRAMYAQLMDQNAGNTDLVLLPEMFSTGFTMDSRTAAEPMGGESCLWLQEQAKQRGVAISGSLAITEGGRYFNRMVFTYPDGSQVCYDKRHLFRMAGEHERYQPGDKRVVVEYRGWKILLQVCYDLRFPVFSRNSNDYDLALYVANWPAPRRQPWRKLLQARAIENLCYVAGVNRVGTDANGHKYSGDSMLVDFKGDLLIDHNPDIPFCDTATLSLVELSQFKESFPAWMDADDFTIDNS